MKNSFCVFVLAFAVSCGGKSADSSGDAAATGASANAVYAVPIDGLPTIGDDAALVTIVEFTDYDCPFCARAEHTMRSLREKYGDDLRVAVAEHPLPMHPHARDAAIAALGVDAASFANVHAQLFDNPDARSPSDLAKLAPPAARATSSPDEALAHAEALGAAVHITGTPTFFVNGKRISGAQPLETFDAVVAEELAHARALVASGVSRSHVYGAIVDAARANPAPFEEEAEKITLIPAAQTAGGAQFLGDPSAKTTITLFTDFECPYCKKLDARLREIVHAHSDVRVVLRNRPLPMHPHARLAAKAAIAASAQNKLDSYALILFANQDALDRAALISYASRAGLDGSRFASDLDSDDTNAKLLEDEALARKLDVKGTPTSFVGARLVVGAQPTATFEDAIEWTSRR